MKDYSDILTQIERAEISPFVWTRLQQKLENKSTSKISIHASRAMVVSLMLLLVLNMVALNRTQKQDDSMINFAESMNLFPQNSIYGE